MRNGVRSLAVAAVAVAQIPIAHAAMQAPAASGVGVIDIRHKNVDCVVAGLHPLFDACMFDPTQLSQARVFFRAAGTQYWYFITMAGQPRANPGCLTGTLPKIKKNMVGRDIEVYLETVDRRLGINQIPPYQAKVVAKESDCDPKRIIAPGVPKASVVVGSAPGAPAAPFGFVSGGISGTTVAFGTLALAGIGGGVVAATSGGSPTSTPTPPVGGPAITPPTPTPSTPTPTPATPTPATPTPPTPTPPNYRVLAATVTPNHGVYGIDLSVSWSASASCSHIKLALGSDMAFHFGLPVNGSFGVAKGEPGYPSWPGSYHYRAICGADSSVERDTNVVTLDPTPTPTPEPKQTPRPTPTPTDTPLGLNDRGPVLGKTSTMQITLNAPGAEGFVLVNGRQTAYPRQGQTFMTLATAQGPNRVEAQVLRAERGGLWTFNLAGVGSGASGSVHVLIGDVARITPTSVTFRLRGLPGERVGFTFGDR